MVKWYFRGRETSIYISHGLICLTHANVWESMGKPSSCTQFIKRRIFYYKSHENPYQVLQVTCDEVKALYDKIVITIVPSYTEKSITCLLPLLMLCARSGIALYYGDSLVPRPLPDFISQPWRKIKSGSGLGTRLLWYTYILS